MSGWKKVLYYDQGYPDNYIEPELFLADLKKNCKQCYNKIHAINIVLIAVHTKPYRYFFVVQESGALVQQLSWYMYCLIYQSLNVILIGNNCKYLHL